MQDNLIQAARCALAELIWQYYEGGLPDTAKRTIVELYDALRANGENMVDYEEDCGVVMQDLAATLTKKPIVPYLKIENVGVCPPEGFTVLGVSLADTSTNEGVMDEE